MALIQGTTSVGLIVGSAGASTFSRNRGGNYTKPRKKSTNPQTSWQMAQRGTIGGMAAAWRNLTDQQRKDWNEVSSQFPYTDKIGTTRYYSGYNLFSKFNTNLYLAGASPITDAVSPTDVGSVSNFIIDHYHISSPVVRASFTGDYTNSNLIIAASNGQSVGIGTISKSTYKNLGNFAANDGANIDLTNAFSDRGIQANTNEKIFFKCYLVGLSTGIASAPALVNGIFI